MEILYADDWIVVCRKAPGILSTDEPGGMPELVRSVLHISNVRTVHRLDRVVGGLMVLARGRSAAENLSCQIREGTFRKQYLAVVHGVPEPEGELRDLLYRDKRECKTYVADRPGKGVQEAVLRYRRLAHTEDMSRVEITLLTGRTHQIRAQFSARGMPLVGDRKYGGGEDGCNIALWSARLGFRHPATGEEMDFTLPPPEDYPWDRV